jgi:hypothetical protein
MVKHLQPDYFATSRPTGFIQHFWDTIDALGGITGLSLITLGILLFYLIVEYAIYRSRQQREAKKKR